MGKRREPRMPIELPLRIFGTDAGGKIFSENVTTMDVSQNGAGLRGIRARIQLDEIVGVMHGSNKVHFRVKWVGEPGTPKQGQVGLLNLTPEKPFWGLTLPSRASDNFQLAGKERRKSVRVKCSISVELHPAGQPVIRARASDLSVGGCFVEIPIPLKVNTSLEIALWLGETKLRLNGEVASTAPGFGSGMRFVNTSQQDQELLEQHITSIADLQRS